MINILDDKEVKRIFALTGRIVRLSFFEKGVKKTTIARLQRIGRYDAELNLLKQGGVTGGIFHPSSTISWANMISIEEASV